MSCVKPVRPLFQLLTHRSNVTSKLARGRSVSGISSRRKSQDCNKPKNKQQELRAIQHVQYSSLAWQPECSTAVESISVDPNGRSCYLTWTDGFQSQFHSAWLRNNCHCTDCRHPNGQKLLDPTSVSSTLIIQRVAIEGETLTAELSGKSGDHTVEIPLAFLRANNYNKETISERGLAAKCIAVSEIPTIAYNDIISSKESYLTWLQQINEDGISLIQGVPLEEDMVHKVAEMIAPVMPTIYGSTFDVEVTPEPINVAYSSLGIGLHQDLVYFESPPGLQLLHCIQFDDCVEGGGNMFLDSFDVADRFRVAYPDMFHTLTTVPATFQKVHYDRDLPVHIVNQKPHMRLNHRGEVTAVYWAPPFEGPLAVAAEDVENYYLAYETFANMLKNSTKLKHRLEPGQLVVFNNLRILHAREAFSTNGGERRLKGCYVNIDLFKSRSQVINNLVGDGRLAKRVGNQCWF